MRLRTIIAVVGYTLVGLILGGLALTVALAINARQPFYGRNIYGLPLGTYSTAAILVIAGGIGIVRLLQLYGRRRPPRQRG